MLTASRERGVIGCREIDAQHPEDRCQEALGLTQRSVKDETERQGGFDGEIGILELPAPPSVQRVGDGGRDGENPPYQRLRAGRREPDDAAGPIDLVPVLSKNPIDAV